MLEPNGQKNLKTKLNSIIKKRDPMSMRSADNLKRIVERKIKDVYVGALRCIEIKFGKSFEGYDEIRKEILRLGNDANRQFNNVVDNSFNIEQIPEVLTFRFNKGEFNEGEGYEGQESI